VGLKILELLTRTLSELIFKATAKD